MNAPATRVLPEDAMLYRALLGLGAAFGVWVVVKALRKR